MIADPAAILVLLRGLAEWVARSGAEACVVAALVLLAQRLLRGRISARWSYNLWLLVLLRLILPALPGSRVSPFNLLPRPWPAKQAALNLEPRRVAMTVATVERHEPPTRTEAFPDPEALAGPLAHGDTGIAMFPPNASGVPLDRELETGPRDTGFPARAGDGGTRETRGTPTQSPLSEIPSPIVPIQLLPSRVGEPASPAPNPNPPQVARDHAWPAWPDLLACLWLAGAALMLVRLAWATLRLSRVVRRLLPVTAPDVLALLDDCRATLNVRRRPGLLLADGSNRFGPALVGLWRPRIVLPADVRGRLSRRELRMVLLHELAHLKRHDLAVNWLLGLLQSVHWFNPGLWLVFRRIRADREVACDELVLAKSDDERRWYAPTILKLLELLCERPDGPTRRAFRAGPAGTFPLAGMVGVLEPVGTGRGQLELRQLQRRITMIAQYDRHSNAGRRWAIAGAAVSLVLGGVALTGAVRADESAAPAAAPQVKPAEPARGAPAVAAAPAAEQAPSADPTAAAPAAAPAVPAAGAAASAGDPLAAQPAADPADPFAGRGEQMAEMRAKIDARLRELREHPDRGSKQEVELLRSMQKMVQAGSAYADARRQNRQTSAAAQGAPAAAGSSAGANVGGGSPLGAAAAAPSASAAGASNPLGSARAAGSAAGQPHRVGQRFRGSQPDVIGIVEDPEAQQADERAAAKLRTKISPQLDGVQLRDALTFVIGQTGVDLFTDWRSLEQLTTIPVTVAAQDIPAEQALDLVLRAAGGDRIGYAIDRGVVVVADRDRINRMVVTRVYDTGDLRAKGDIITMIYSAVAPSSWSKVEGDDSHFASIQQFGDKLVITQTEPNHRQIVRLLALLRQRTRPDGARSGQNTTGGREAAVEDPAKYGDMPWRDVPPPLRERAMKLWNGRFKNNIYYQDGKALNRIDIEKQFLDAVRAMEKEQPSPDTAQPQPGAADPNETSGHDTPAARRR